MQHGQQFRPRRRIAERRQPQCRITPHHRLRIVNQLEQRLMKRGVPAILPHDPRRRLPYLQIPARRLRDHLADTTARRSVRAIRARPPAPSHAECGAAWRGPQNTSRYRNRSSLRPNQVLYQKRKGNSTRASAKSAIRRYARRPGRCETLGFSAAMRDSSYTRRACRYSKSSASRYNGLRILGAQFRHVAMDVDGARAMPAASQDPESRRTARRR